jgi:hypothetical protein
MDIERAVFKEMVFKDMLEEGERELPIKELMQSVKYYTEELLDLYWGEFLRSEPIDPGHKREILSRLDALRRIVGDESFKRAYYLGCLDFGEEPLHDIFLFGSNTQRMAAVREKKIDRDRELEDDAIRRIRARVRMPQHVDDKPMRTLLRFLQGDETKN